MSERTIITPEIYMTVRKNTELICKSLEIEDYVVQPVVYVSPPKWHLSHTTWFFETFILVPNVKDYKEFNSEYSYLFNSYYESVGKRVLRPNRGNLTRPTVAEIYKYREYVDKAMYILFSTKHILNELIRLGINHEEQHQELLYTDIKYILGHNPLFPVYKNLGYSNDNKNLDSRSSINRHNFIHIEEGIYEIGYSEIKDSSILLRIKDSGIPPFRTGFCFDNELGRHKVYLNSFSISHNLVTNGEYLEFINDDGYKNFKYWHADGWSWVQKNNITSPLYWHLIDNKWYTYTFEGLQPINMEEYVCHVSFYEAAAYAEWKGMRLPTEFEWEISSELISWGSRWEWTNSAYLPYPNFKRAPGAIGEYNGKFMVNQMVLRGASEVTPPNHSRSTYRNFFQPELRWQFTGIRLAK